MSTVASFSYIQDKQGEYWHLYEDFMEMHDTVFLDGPTFSAKIPLLRWELMRQSKTSPKELPEIPQEIWDEFRHYTIGHVLDMVKKSDKEMEDYIQKSVDARIEKFEKSEGYKKGLVSMGGFLCFGPAGAPREVQIEWGRKYYYGMRAKVKDTISQEIEITTRKKA